MSNLLLSGGTFYGRGTLTVPTTGAADLASGSFGGGFRLVNRGTLTVAAIATLNFADSSEIENTATMTLADNDQVGPLCCSAANGFVVNDAGATLSYAGSATSSSTSVGVPFDNYGTVNVTRGTLNLNSGSVESDGDNGAYNVAAAGALTYSGYRTLGPAVTFPGAGPVTVSGQIGLAAGTALSLPNLLLSGGTLYGKGSLTIPSGQSATLAGGALSGGVRVINRGALTISTNTTLTFADRSVLENAGSLALADGIQVGPEDGISNDGTVINDSGATVSYTGSASNSQATMAAQFDNFGTVTIGRGTLNVNGNSSDASAGDTGVYNVSATAFLAFGGFRLFAAGVSFPGAGQVANTGGLQFLGSTTLPNLAWQSGSIEIAGGTTLNVTLSGAPSGALQVDGDRPGHFGKLVATGAVSLSNLSLTLSNDTFTPPCGEVDTVAQAGSIANQFNTVTDTNLPAGGNLVATYTPSAVRTLINCPPPPAAAAQTYGTGRSFDINNPSGYYAEPVDTATGSYSTQQTDARLYGIGLPFVFTRYYTSANTAAGRLGRGWTDSLSASLSPQGSTVYLTSENGQVATFTQQSDGSYLGGTGVYSQLTQTSAGWTVTRRDRTELTFDATGRLLSMKDGNGTGLALTYNSGGQLVSVKDSGGRTVTFAYNSQGLLKSISLPLSRTVTYAYNAAKQLASVTDASGDVTTYAYNAAGLLAKMTDANGHAVVQNTYSSSGQVVKQTNATGQSSEFAYNSTNNITTFTDARGNKWRDEYNGNVLTQRTDPLGHVTSYAYDSNQNVSALSDANGNTTLMDYDSAGNLIDRTSPAPYHYEETWSYNGLNEPLTYTDRRGLTTKYAYDSRGNLVKVTASDGTSVSHTYDSTTGALVSTTSASGKTASYSYDSSGDLAKVTSPLGEITTYGYDGAGRRTSQVSPRGNVSGATASQFTTSYAYDADDRLQTLTDPLGDTTTTTYDKVGNRLSLRNPNGHTTFYGYDAANHLTLVTASDGTKTNSTYDAVGNLATRVDANANTTTYAYDAANRRIALTTPRGHTTSYSYDRTGNLTKAVDPIGASTSYAYDALNRPISVTYSDGTPTITYSYDPDSNRTVMTDGSGTTNYTFNNRNLLTKVSHGTTSFSYTYTVDGLVSGRTYPDGLAATATYDADGSLASVTSGGRTTAYAYDPDGNPTTTTLPTSTGVTELRTYDDADRLASVNAARGSTSLDSFALLRDAAGNPTAIATPSGPITYSYDSRERITQACYGASCATRKLSWTYDAVGNRLTATSGSTTTTNTYDADNELTKSVTGSTTIVPAYDADGRQTAYGTTTSTWNGANELTAIGGPNAATYSYDGDGNRVAVKIGTNTTTQTWDVNSPLAQLATTQGPAGTQNYLSGVGSLGFTTSAGSFYTLHDDQGSSIGVVSSDGTLQSTASYDPYGVTIATTKPVSTAPTNQIAWQGQLADSSGQYDLRAREYDPAAGQFLSRDPLEVSSDQPLTSPYIYANNQPTLLQDPTGMSWSAFWSGTQGAAEEGYSDFVSLGDDTLKSVAGDVVAGVSIGTDLGSTLATCAGNWSSMECGRSIQETGVGVSEFLVGTVCDVVTDGWGAVACNAAVSAGGQFLLDRYGIRVPGDASYGSRRLGYALK